MNKAQSFFVNIPITFYHFATKSITNKILIFFFLLLVWALAIFSFSRIELSSTSADLLPDSSIKLQKMAKGMDLAPFSRLFFIDIHEKNGNTKILEESARIIEASVDREIAIPLHEQGNISPTDLMQFLPNFFTEDAEVEAYKKIEEENASISIENAMQNLSTFAPASLTAWLLTDPFDFKTIILQNLPYSFSNNSSFSFNEYTYSEDKKHILLTFQPLVSIHDTSSASKLITNIRESAKKLPSSVELNFNGGIVHTAVNTQVIENDIKNIVFYSLIGLILLYIFLVRSFSGIWLLLTPALAISLSLGVMTSVSVVVSGLALGFGSAVLGIAEDYAVHIHCALEKEKNLDKILSLLTIPLFQGFLLNVSGFFVLSFSSLPAIRQLACFALLSLCFGFLIALFILPLCPRFKTFTFIAKKENSLKEELTTENNEQNSHHQSKAILSSCLILCFLLCTFSYILFMHTRVDVSPRSMGMTLDFNDTNSQKFAQTWLSASNSKNAHSAENSSLFILEADNEENLFHNSRLIAEKLNKKLAENLDNSKKSTNTLSSAKTDNKVDTLAFFFPSIKEQEENIQRFKNFADKNKNYLHSLIQEKTTYFGMPAEIFNPFFNILNEERKLIDITHISQSPLASLLDFFVLKDVENGKTKYFTLFISKGKITLNNEELDSLHLIELSPEALENEILSTFYKEASYLPLALLLCTVILYLCYFNIAKTLLALTPALFSLFSVLLGMYLLDSPLTLGALTALLLVLGLALDHGILVSSDLEHGAQFNLNRAILISSLSTVLGIGLLAFATHPTLRDMGRIILLGLLLEVPVSLYLLPLLCKKTKSKEEKCEI